MTGQLSKKMLEHDDIGLLSDDGKPDRRDEVAEALEPIADNLARHPVLKRFTDLEFRPPQVKVEIKDGADAESARVATPIAAKTLASNASVATALRPSPIESARCYRA